MPKTFTITLTEREFGNLEIAVSAMVVQTAARASESETSKNDMYKHLLSKLVKAEQEQGWLDIQAVGA